ncbi:MAG: arginase [Proteobacteria bacterium]|nr:arginase [Pseudomonadota bacterium]
MLDKKCILVGIPLDCGKVTKGCVMGPDAYRTVGLFEVIQNLGYEVFDFGNVSPETFDSVDVDNLEPYKLNENIAWTGAIAQIAKKQMQFGLPIFMGGDHAVSMGSVSGVAAYAATQNRPLFVLWLDAHSDFHTPQSTKSGNLHGTPMAYFTGQAGFEKFPEPEVIVDPRNVFMIGLRSVDHPEKEALDALSISIADMRFIDEFGIKPSLLQFLARVRDSNGLLHVSFDVDFLDPMIAPAVGTTVPGGATIREAHLTMELLHDSGLVTSLDLVELNPMLDENGKTAKLMVDLTASILGKRIFDKPTGSL